MAIETASIMGKLSRKAHAQKNTIAVCRPKKGENAIKLPTHAARAKRSGDGSCIRYFLKKLTKEFIESLYLKAIANRIV